MVENDDASAMATSDVITTFPADTAKQMKVGGKGYFDRTNEHGAKIRYPAVVKAIDLIDGDEAKVTFQIDGEPFVING